jgi:cytochrome c oxidase cbb3-type subunit 1
MTAPSSTTPQQIDASCRLPLFALFGGAAFWLALSSVFGLIASIKFHGPGFFAHSATLTYGRVYPAWSNLLVYGFCIPAGLGVGLWLLARLGHAPLARPWLVAVGAKLWHLGVFVGLLGILNGDSTGFAWLEMPRYSAMILFCAFVFIGVWGFVTHRARAEQELYPSQWFVLAALFWFPWIYSTAVLLLQVFPVRGLVQASIAWWFSGNLLVVWLSLVGLAAFCYFVPKLTERPLQSRYLALFTFWTLILFGTWTGIPSRAPLPAWMPALSSAAAVMTLIPVLAVAVVLVQTVGGTKTACAGGPLCYVKFGVWSLVLSGLMLAATAVPPISRVTNFTWFGHAQTGLRLYGFFAMSMFGAAYYVLPRVTGAELPFAKLVRGHFWCGVIGTLLVTVPLAIGGVLQGVKWLNPEISPVDVSKATLMFLRVSTLGDLLLLLGNLFFLLNVFVVILRYYRSVVRVAYADVTALEPVEVHPVR